MNRINGICSSTFAVLPNKKKNEKIKQKYVSSLIWFDLILFLFISCAMRFVCMFWRMSVFERFMCTNTSAQTPIHEHARTHAYATATNHVPIYKQYNMYLYMMYGSVLFVSVYSVWIKDTFWCRNVCKWFDRWPSLECVSKQIYYLECACGFHKLNYAWHSYNS